MSSCVGRDSLESTRNEPFVSEVFSPVRFVDLDRRNRRHRFLWRRRRRRRGVRSRVSLCLESKERHHSQRPSRGGVQECPARVREGLRGCRPPGLRGRHERRRSAFGILQYLWCWWWRRVGGQPNSRVLLENADAQTWLARAFAGSITTKRPRSRVERRPARVGSQRQSREQLAYGDASSGCGSPCR